MVVGLGPGFSAGEDVDVVIETNRGHDLARLILEVYGRSPIPVCRATWAEKPMNGCSAPPAEGLFRGVCRIGAQVQAGQTVAEIDGLPVVTRIDGILRGLLRDGLSVTEGFKVADVDPRCRREHCFTISDKARAVGGGVLEAILMFLTAKKGVAG